MRAQIGAADIAVWRSRSGKLAAWENRCPHRGMRLSHGFVRGEALACLYHGWHYNGAGICTYIPAHPDLEPPETICTNAHAVAEQGGVIWVSTASDAPAMAMPGNVHPVRSLTFDCSPERVCDAMTTLPLPNGETVAQDGAMALHTETAGKTGLVVVLQQPAPSEVTAHILAGADATAQDLVAISRWAEAVRRLAEREGQDGGIT